jgi:RsiW-degrading membrane proteinase PrsW (M82 family)
MITSDPKILGLALLAGIIPSLLWLWFWIKEEGKRPEPRGLLALVFILGMLATLLVLPIQKFIKVNVSAEDLQLILWAASEEIIKFLVVLVLLYNTNEIDEPTDWPIYMMTAALGFAALENALFLLKPFALGQTTVGLLTGQLRFLGSTLLHAVSSGIVGISLGLSFNMHGFGRRLYFYIGALFAIALHSAFNFFIMRASGGGFLQVFAFLWVAAVIVMLIFEKLRRMS